MRLAAGLALGGLLLGAPGHALQAEQTQAHPGEAAVLSLGGRLYDNHWAVTGRQPPPDRHPLAPAELDVSPAATWRCVTCHGWDYRGVDGHLGSISSAPVFKSLAGTRGQDPEKLVARMMAPPHRDMTTPVPGDLLLAIAKFLSVGQHDMSSLVDAKGTPTGDPLHGKDIYEGTCVRCHQADGKAPLYGEAGDKSSLGWIARNRPEQAVHKIRNGVPLADMLSLRFLDMESLSGLLAYLRKLDPPQ